MLDTIACRCQNGHAAIVNQLLAKEGIDVNVMDDNNDTPLNVAAKHGQAVVVKQLLAKQGIEVNQANYDAQSPLLSAFQGGHKDIVNQLLAKDGVDVNQGGKYGFTPLHLAAHHGVSEFVELLLAKKGINVNKSAEYGVTPLYLAAKHGHAEVVTQLLAKKGIELNPLTKGMSPLCVAAQNGHADIVELLLAKEGIDVNKSAENGVSPLHLAAKHGHADIVELFRKDILKKLEKTGKTYTRNQFKKLSIKELRDLQQEIEPKMPCAEQTGITTAKISQANAESIKRARQNKINQLNETLNNENIGIKLVVDEHDSVFLVPNNFHIQTGPVKVECDGKYITFDKVKHVTIFKQGKNKRLTKLYYSEDAKPLSDKDVESKKLVKYKRTSQIRHLGDLSVVDAIYHQKYPLGMDTKHRATVRIIFRALANDGREEQPPAPSSQGHHHPVKPPGSKRCRCDAKRASEKYRRKEVSILR